MLEIVVTFINAEILHLSSLYVTLVYRNVSHSFLKAALRFLPFQNVIKLFYRNLLFDVCLSNSLCISHSLVVSHFTPLSAFPALLIIPHPFPIPLSSFKPAPSPLFVVIAPHNMLSISPVSPLFIFPTVWEMFGKDKMERGSGKKNEWMREVGHEK